MGSPILFCWRRPFKSFAARLESLNSRSGAFILIRRKNRRAHCARSLPQKASWSSKGQSGYGILLYHYCDIQPDRHGHANRLIALVRAIDPRLPEVQKDILRQNGNFYYFYLPADPESAFEESYVDFSRISCIAPQHVDAGQRLMSLSRIPFKFSCSNRPVLDPSRVSLNCG